MLRETKVLHFFKSFRVVTAQVPPKGVQVKILLSPPQNKKALRFHPNDPE